VTDPEQTQRPKRVAVVGLGRFGLSAGRRLAAEGVDVIGIDRSARVVDEARDQLPLVVQAQLQEEGVVDQLGLPETDAAIIAIGDDALASIFITALLVEAKVPTVVARAHTPLHGRILERVGAHVVVYPETEGGEALAGNLLGSHLGPGLVLSAGVSIAKSSTPSTWVGRTVAELHEGVREGFVVVVIQRGDETLIAPDPDERLQEEDVLAVLGEDRELGPLLASLHQET
jgi:trk system potassium uptake protein TrkA